MLLGLIRPDAGTAKLFGRDPLVEGARALDGVAGFVEAPRFYPYLSGRRNLELRRRARRRRRRGADRRGARHRRPRRPRQATRSAATRTGCASGSGSPGRCCATRGCCCSTSRRPGSTRPACATCAGSIRRLADAGHDGAALLHLMAEVEELCDRVAIVRSGRIVYEGALAELMRTAAAALRAAHHRRRARAGSPRAAGIDERALRRRRGLTFTADEAAAVPALSLALAEAGVGIARAGAADRDARGPVLPLTEGERHERQRRRTRASAGAGARVAAAPPGTSRSTAGSCASCAPRSAPTSGSAPRRSCR